MKNLFVFALIAGVAACTVWKRVPIETAPSAAQHDTAVVGEGARLGGNSAHSVRVTLVNGALWEFRAIATHGPTLYGFSGEDSTAVPRDSVQLVQTRVRSTGRTVALGLVGAVLYGVAVFALSDRPCTNGGPYC